MLATLLTNREVPQRAGGRVGVAAEPATQERLDTLTQNYLARGLDPSAAQDSAIKLLDNIVRRESYVMAYNDAFLVLGVALLCCIAAVWMGKKVLGGTAVPAMRTD